MILKRKNRKQTGGGRPARKPQSARKLFEPDVRPLDTGFSPFLGVRQPRRAARRLALAAIGIALLGQATGQESNQLRHVLIRTNAAATPEQVTVDTNAAVEDTTLLRQEPGSNGFETNGVPRMERVPEESHEAPPAIQMTTTHENGVEPGETTSKSEAATQEEAAGIPQPRPGTSLVTSAASPAVAREQESSGRDRSPGEYRKRTRGEENRTNTTPAAGSRATARAAKTVEDFSNFRIVADRNIFNPNRRYSRPGESQPKPKQVDSFGLVGVMSYEKGTFAFFDGSTSDFKKVLKSSDKIANYTICEITPNAVKLDNGGKKLELHIGAQLRREDQGEWTLSNEPQSYAVSSTASSSNANASAATDAPSGADADVLKKLMQRREQE